MTQQSYSDLLGPLTYGAGFQQVALPANPAAGAEFVAKVPGGLAWRVISARMHLATSAVAATRVPRFAIRDGDGNDIVEVQAVNGVLAGSAADQFFVTGIDLSSSRTAIGIPSLILHPGFSVVIGATNRDAGDQISGIRLWTEQFQIGRGAYSISGLSPEESTS